MKPNIFVLLSTCVEVSVSLLYLFVYEPLYQTVGYVAIPFFAAVLGAWTTVPFSMLEWDLLRLALTTIMSQRDSYRTVVR